MAGVCDRDWQPSGLQTSVYLFVHSVSQQSFQHPDPHPMGQASVWLSSPGPQSPMAQAGLPQTLLAQSVGPL